MNWLVYIFGSGEAFFLGVGAVLTCVVAFARTERAWLKVLATLIAVVGLVFIVFSSTPLPYWLYALAGVITVFWLVCERSRRPWLTGRRRGLRIAVMLVWAAATIAEIPYRMAPIVAAAGHPKVYILGDSISAGLSDGDDTWPRILARTRSIEVDDLSRVGADVASSLRQAERLPTDGGLVILEIGGNDLLGSTSAAAFGQGLDRLLGRVCVPGRTVIMFELPLPPFCNEYGLIQRRLAAKYDVPLIPKHIMLAVLTGDDATLDALHLTRAGHQRMADAVWAVIQPAFN